MADKPLLDKLGIRAGHRVSVLRIDAPWFLEDLRRRGADVSLRRRKQSDLIFIGCDRREQLSSLSALEPYLRRDGAVWVITPKGVDRIKQTDVIPAGIAAGYIDNKVASFSETHSAMRLVIPLARR